LKALRREVRALEALDEATKATGEGGDSGKDREPGRPQQDRRLQRAGLVQRLLDLLAKKQQWKARLFGFKG
jgi:hypothetical protein